MNPEPLGSAREEICATEELDRKIRVLERKTYVVQFIYTLERSVMGFRMKLMNVKKRSMACFGSS